MVSKKDKQVLDLAHKHMDELSHLLRPSGRESLEALEEQSYSCDYMSSRMLRYAHDDATHRVREANEMLDRVTAALKQLTCRIS